MVAPRKRPKGVRSYYGPFGLSVLVMSLSALQKAKRVYVLTVTNEKEFDTRRSASELAKHLTHHGVEVIVDAVDAAERTTAPSALASWS